jgi:hypothetical protein
LLLRGSLSRACTIRAFWRQWIFWPPPRYPRIIAVYKAVFAFIAKSTVCAMLALEFYRYGVFRLAEARLSELSILAFRLMMLAQAL